MGDIEDRGVEGDGQDGSDLVQIIMPVEEEALRGISTKVHWSLVDKDEHVTIRGDLATVLTGYRSARASHCVSRGAWFYEVEVYDESDKVRVGPGGQGHCRVGWAMDRVPFEDLSAPVGYGSIDEEWGFSYSYGSKDGNKFCKSAGKAYGEPFQKGDVIGCLLELPTSEPSCAPAYSTATIYKASKMFHCPHWLAYKLPRRPEVCEGSRISFYKNGTLQGEAFTDVWRGFYFPAVSGYYGGAVMASFGPDFKFPPGDVDFKPMCEATKHTMPFLQSALERETELFSQGVEPPTM